MLDNQRIGLFSNLKVEKHYHKDCGIYNIKSPTKNSGLYGYSFGYTLNFNWCEGRDLNPHNLAATRT